MEETKTQELANVKDVLAEIAAGDLNRGAFERLRLASFASAHALDSLRDAASHWDSSLGNKETNAILRGYCLFLTGALDEARDVLQGSRRSVWGAYHLARTLERQNWISEALKAAREGLAKNEDSVELRELVVELACRRGEIEEAAKILGELRKEVGGTPDVIFLEGYLHERNGEYARALDLYRDVVRLDEQHARAWFRLGYVIELHGTEADEVNEEAIEAYERCVKIPPVHTQAVTNLGLLYEDRELYHDAIKCYETVLEVYPNDERARLYLNDARACTRMFYDREQEKKADKQSQVLKIPVSDFELSVRSRNCLHKMNIQTLGDLIMKTEQELLSYKNFGETSLAEIKDMLNQKGLRLGQGLDTKGGEPITGRNPLEATAPPEVLSRPIEELNFSVRSRRCMERLEVRTVRDLINKTEVELMSAKNFGMTSLNEIKRKLGEIGLSLRP